MDSEDWEAVDREIDNKVANSLDRIRESIRGTWLVTPYEVGILLDAFEEEAAWLRS